jgi:5,10-methylenetetrahydromethanopterin reductase
VVLFWLGTFPLAGRAVELAELAENDGWDGLAFTDSQNLGGDTFAALGIAAHASKRIMLATAATNPGTRHPAVVASAIATIQVESAGRAWLGIARGDSAMEFIGRHPMPLRTFERSLQQISTYLRGETVDLDGFESRLQWLPADLPPIPMSVAATGPKVIDIAARVADGVTFSVGADVDRLRSCIAIARAAAGDRPLRIGAYVNAVAHPDVEVARGLVRGRMGVYARFSTMDQRVMASLTEQDRAVAEKLVNAYDMHSHAASGGRQEAALDDSFVDRFGIVGPSSHVAERLVELIGLGLDHVIVVGHSRNTPAAVFAESSHRFGTEVLPEVRRAIS